MLWVKYEYCDIFFFLFQQLHSSVRTGNLETCLRLLSLGAQANFFHPVRLTIYFNSPVVHVVLWFALLLFLFFIFCWVYNPLLKEKGNSPLHVAAKAGQVFQAELLTVYGADPGAPDSSGKTPIDYARLATSSMLFKLFNQSLIGLDMRPCNLPIKP